MQDQAVGQLVDVAVLAAVSQDVHVRVRVLRALALHVVEACVAQDRQQAVELFAPAAAETSAVRWERFMYGVTASISAHR